MKLPLAAGEVVAGVYTIERIIGVGGMAVVAEASHQAHRQRVAIKLLLPEVASSKQTVKRFEREQRTLAQLHSEHVVRIYGSGTHGKLPFMILELLRGSDLSELLKNQGPMQIDDAVRYMLQTCHALAEAHSLGIVHRDIKPGNLFITRRSDGSPCIKVLDFGISKASTRDSLVDTTLTQTTTVVGSPFYMSPEALLSAKEADARSDIWALGVTLFELLTKTLPFAAETTEAVCQRILNGAPTPIRKIRPMVPGGLEAVVMRCLQRRPRERFANVSDLAQRLADFGPEHTRYAVEAIYELLPPTERDPQRAAAVAHAQQQEVDVSTGGDTTLYLPASQPTRGGRSWLLTLGVAAGAFALGAGFGWVMGLPTAPTAGLPLGAPAQASPAPAQTQAEPNVVAAPASATTEVAARRPIDLDEPPEQPAPIAKPWPRAPVASARLDEGLPRPAPPVVPAGGVATPVRSDANGTPPKPPEPAKTAAPAPSVEF